MTTGSIVTPLELSVLPSTGMADRPDEPRETGQVASENDDFFQRQWPIAVSYTHLRAHET
jgi:hypothetical protein